MKLHELKEAVEPQVTDEQMDMAYKAILKKEFDRDEIVDLAAEFADSGDFGRTKNSAIFLLNRMHILVHSIAPHGETERRAETMFQISQKLEDFADKKGLDADENIKAARKELSNRTVEIKVKKPEAIKMMADYHKANKAKMTADMRPHRDEIIDNIMKGLTPEEAFSRFL